MSPSCGFWCLSWHRSSWCYKKIIDNYTRLGLRFFKCPCWCNTGLLGFWFHFKFSFAIFSILTFMTTPVLLFTSSFLFGFFTALNCGYQMMCYYLNLRDSIIFTISSNSSPFVGTVLAKVLLPNSQWCFSSVGWQCHCVNKQLTKKHAEVKCTHFKLCIVDQWWPRTHFLCIFFAYKCKVCKVICHSFRTLDTFCCNP